MIPIQINRTYGVISLDSSDMEDEIYINCPVKYILIA